MGRAHEIAWCLSDERMMANKWKDNSAIIRVLTPRHAGAWAPSTMARTQREEQLRFISPSHAVCSAIHLLLHLCLIVQRLLLKTLCVWNCFITCWLGATVAVWSFFLTLFFSHSLFVYCFCSFFSDCKVLFTSVMDSWVPWNCIFWHLNIFVKAGSKNYEVPRL